MSRIAYFALKQQLKDAEYNLAAAQAREKVLRDALFELANLHVVVYSQSPEGRTYMKKLGDLMASSDDTALRAELKAERERLAVIAEKLGKELAEMNEDSSMKFVGGSIACAIRALEDN